MSTIFRTRSYYVAPNVVGDCEYVKSTERSLTFRWMRVQAAINYRLVGHSVDMSPHTNSTIVTGLTPGSRYTFTVWAVGARGLRSNNITCSNSTGSFCPDYHSVSVTEFSALVK